MLNNSQIIAQLVVSAKGNWDLAYNNLIKKDYSFDEEITIEESFITPLDKKYPERLKGVYKQPLTLFYRGNLSLLDNENLVSVVSSRNSGFKDYELAKALDIVFSEKLIYIVNPRSEIGKAIISRNGKVIVVANCGLDNFDKATMDKVLSNGGLVITEYPNGVYEDMNTNLMSARIRSGLEHKLVVVSVKVRSGTMVQINHSLTLGHDIYVLPLSFADTTECINNKIIQEGANVLTGIEDLL